MILGIGLDIVDVGRFERALSKRGERMRARFFTPGEQKYCDGKRRPAAHFAGRFAAKEAFAKALGSGIARGIRWVDVEIIADDSGRPTLKLHGHASDFYLGGGGKKLFLSITHAGAAAAATVVIEG